MLHKLLERPTTLDRGPIQVAVALGPNCMWGEQFRPIKATLACPEDMTANEWQTPVMSEAISWRASATLKPDRAALSIARWIMLEHTLRNSKRTVALATVKDVQRVNV
jgi:hypothetical protein